MGTKQIPAEFEHGMHPSCAYFQSHTLINTSLRKEAFSTNLILFKVLHSLYLKIFQIFQLKHHSTIIDYRMKWSKTGERRTICLEQHVSPSFNFTAPTLNNYDRIVFLPTRFHFLFHFSLFVYPNPMPTSISNILCKVTIIESALYARNIRDLHSVFKENSFPFLFPITLICAHTHIHTYGHRYTERFGQHRHGHISTNLKRNNTGVWYYTSHI